MNNLQIFKNKEFGEVRTITIGGEPWFVASDICKALELSNATVSMQRLEDDEKSKFNLGLSGGDTNCVNEYGLYSLVLASRKPEARKFKRWITHEVLPSIRKHGMYAVDQLIEDPDLAIKAFTALKEERERNKILEADNKRMKPKEIFADAVAASEQSILIGQLAKLICQNGYEIGQKRLFKWMRDKGYLMKSGSDYNMPMQRYVEQGLFEIKESSVANPDGSVRLTKTTKVTGKGQQYFINKFLA